MESGTLVRYLQTDMGCLNKKHHSIRASLIKPSKHDRFQPIYVPLIPRNYLMPPSQIGTLAIANSVEGGSLKLLIDTALTGPKCTV